LFFSQKFLSFNYFLAHIQFPSVYFAAMPAMSSLEFSSVRNSGRDRGRSNSPNKHPPSAKKRRPAFHEPLESQDNDVILPDSDDNPQSTGLESVDISPSFQVQQQPEIQITTEILDLKHQISVISAQINSLQSLFQTQMGVLASQITGLVQQVSRIQRGSSCTLKQHTTIPTESNPSTGPEHSIQGPAPPIPARPGPKTKAKASYAETLANARTPITKNPEAARRPMQILRPQFEPNDQKVIVQVHPNTNPKSDMKSTWSYLQLANKAVREYNKNPEYCFVRCHVTDKNNLVLQTSGKTKASHYTDYLNAIKMALEQGAGLEITSIDSEPRWSKFLLHGVPTYVSMMDVANSIQESYPGALKLAQTPRWLTTETKRQNSVKGISTVVLSIVGRHTLQSLGYQYLFICNNRCRLDKYLPYGPSSQCGKCCKLGHPTTMCRDENPTCGICGQPHTTRYHPCPAPDCPAGGKCIHTPMHCVNCQSNLHTSINPACPQREKARLQQRNLGVIPEFNTSVELSAPKSTDSPDTMQIENHS
jgi:hypothetical protein